LLAEEGYLSIKEVFVDGQSGGQCQPLYFCLGQSHCYPKTKD
jgi:hypothetical protein